MKKLRASVSAFIADDAGAALAEYGIHDRVYRDRGDCRSYVLRQQDLRKVLSPRKQLQLSYERTFGVRSRVLVSEI